MVYFPDNPIIEIVSAERMKWNSGFFSINPRNYSAQAFRIYRNAIITVTGKKYTVNENDVLYLPQNLSYQAKYTDTEIIVIH